MIARLRARWRTGHAEAGVSLVELMVAMGLMSLVSTLTLYFFLGVSKAADTTDAANGRTAQARAVLDGWSGLLRNADSPTMPGQTGDRFVQLTPTSAVFFANVGTNRDGTAAAPGAARTTTQKVSLSLENGSLVERLYGTDGSVGAPQVFATKVSTTGWLFTPYTGTPPQVATLNACPGGAAGLCASTTAGATALANVTRVDLQFSLALPASAVTQTFSSSAALSGTGT